MADKLKVPDLLSVLWREFAFAPNDEQQAAILHTDGPLFLPAGPGSGKTRVLLWRTVNLIATHGILPDEIFLSTFTEKASLQLCNGLRTLLSAVSDKTGKPYDTAKLYVGTVHSLCQRLILDRRISAHRSRSKSPVLLDELDQYMFIRRRRNWDAILQATGFRSPANILAVFEDHGRSRHKAITHLLSFFNRLSEEMIDPAAARKRTRDGTLHSLLDGYEAYRALLQGDGGMQRTDLSLVQSVAVDHLLQNPESGRVFRHVIIDEYQDTNPVQERIFLQLASGHKNICVVGDDDQALYRFRGATVENFVEFPDRCQKHLGVLPRRIVLGTNYRSREDIVRFYNRFIVHPSCDWRKGSKGAYRVMDKEIIPHRKEKATAVVASSPGAPEHVAEEIATLVRQLIDAKKVEDPNQIAFLFPSLKSPHVDRMRDALAKVGLEVYAPRAGQFLEVSEAQAVFGLIFQVFGSFTHVHTEFQSWLTSVYAQGASLMAADPFLDRFVKQKVAEAQQISADYSALAKVLDKRSWSSKVAYDPATMPAVLASAPGLSDRAKRALTSQLFARFARERSRIGKPFTIGYAITRATSLDWNILDFFYQLSGFKHFKAMFDLAESGKDEGPACNLSLISQYVARFLDHYPFPISGESLSSGQFMLNFANYLYVLFRRGEGEYEDADDPFPKGRIPFITVHQSKGLEFPVVILANPRKDPKLQPIEEMVTPLLTRKGEPLDRMPTFDVMRMFYVALSRAKNLLVLAHFQGRGQRLHEAFADLMSASIPRIPSFKVSTVPAANLEDQELPQSYSYTGDFLLYRKCPRQYMLFRKYGFAPSRSQTMFFGSLVHETLEDLHQQLIHARSQAA
jgi:DNA helicase II / ATP-dependent DNA helicase PcrA